MKNAKYILTISCRDDFGIVAAVSGCLSQLGAFIIESSQFGDTSTERFFMRLVFSLDTAHQDQSTLATRLSPIIDRYQMTSHLRPIDYKPRTLIMVSKESHCLNDILHRVFTKTLGIDVEGIISNHEVLEPIAQWYGIPFHYVPVSEELKSQAEDKLRQLVATHRVDLVVLARYMQVLSSDLCQQLHGKVINIHHSFLPSFKGAQPYHQAYDRGVKVIGATAHYVTPDLDEGPIIHQETIRVSHDHGPRHLIAMGRDVECLVLSRAIALHAEDRVLLNGHKTVVFS